MTARNQILIIYGLIGLIQLAILFAFLYIMGPVKLGIHLLKLGFILMTLILTLEKYRIGRWLFAGYLIFNIVTGIYKFNSDLPIMTVTSIYVASLIALVISKRIDQYLAKE